MSDVFVQKAAKKRKFQVIVVECAPEYQVHCCFSSFLLLFTSSLLSIDAIILHFVLSFYDCLKAASSFQSWYYRYLLAIIVLVAGTYCSPRRACSVVSQVV